MKLNFLLNFFLLSPIRAYHAGLELGIATLSTGLIMDNTISKKSLEKLKTDSKELYKKGMTEATKNLIILGPSYYWAVDNFIISNHFDNVNLLHTFDIVSIHSLGYYAAHRMMHRSDLFRRYHNFHHKFNETLIPSIGNAVSSSEFTFAYMTPFIIGAIIIDPNINSFNLGILIVSIMNLIIHTDELSTIKYNKYFVSPKTHLNHHQGKNIKSTYSAPTFNLEEIWSTVLKKYK